MLSIPIYYYYYYIWVTFGVIQMGFTFRISHDECNNQTYQKIEIKASRLMDDYKLEYMVSVGNTTNGHILENCKKYCCKDNHCKLFVSLGKVCYKLTENAHPRKVHQNVTLKNRDETYKVYIKWNNKNKCEMTKGLHECSQIDNQITNFLGFNKIRLEMAIHTDTLNKMHQLLHTIPKTYQQCSIFIKNYFCYKNRMVCDANANGEKSVKPCPVAKNTIHKWCHNYSDKVLLHTNYLTRSNVSNNSCFKLVQPDNITYKEVHKKRRLLLVHQPKPLVRFIPANNSNDLQKGLNSINFDSSKQSCEKLCRNRGQCVLGDNTEMRCQCYWPYFFNNPLKKENKYCEFNVWTALGVTLLVLSITMASLIVLHQHYTAKKRADTIYGSATQKILNFISDDPNSNKFSLFNPKNQIKHHNNSTLSLNGRNPYNGRNSSSFNINKSQTQQFDKETDEIVLYDRNQMLSNLQQLSIMNRKKIN